MWDGKIRLYSTTKKELYIGLLSYVLVFAKERRIHIVFLTPMDTIDNFTLDNVKKISSDLNIHKIINRDFNCQKA